VSRAEKAAAVCLDLPWVSPFLQVTQGIGEFDTFTIGGGLEMSSRERSGTRSSPDPMRFAATPYLANNIVGDVQSRRIGVGLSLAFHPVGTFRTFFATTPSSGR
jgi:hypothetical protein